MPLYFFHLNFGGRIVPDDEGVEMPNRSAARAEASAVIRDLSNPEVTGNPRRWATLVAPAPHRRLKGKVCSPR